MAMWLVCLRGTRFTILSLLRTQASGWTRPWGHPRNTWPRHTDGHFWRVGLDSVSAWDVMWWVYQCMLSNLTSPHLGEDINRAFMVFVLSWFVQYQCVVTRVTGIIFKMLIVFVWPNKGTCLMNSLIVIL